MAMWGRPKIVWSASSYSRCTFLKPDRRRSGSMCYLVLVIRVEDSISVSSGGSVLIMASHNEISNNSRVCVSQHIV
jgi:hypothetical protein